MICDTRECDGLCPYSNASRVLNRELMKCCSPIWCCIVVSSHPLISSPYNIYGIMESYSVVSILSNLHPLITKCILNEQEFVRYEDGWYQGDAWVCQ